jgi:2-iminobutanoate/2-iminopropanoate deaminase
MKTERRSALKKLSLSVLSLVGLRSLAGAATTTKAAPEKEVSGIIYDQEVPMYSSVTKLGNMIFLAGKGAHYSGDIKAHTETVLKDLEAELKKAGSSMEKVLKVNVYLNDLADFEAMNSVYRGRFGKNPPVRTTVAVAKGGVPGDSLVEIDCIAYI